MSIKEILSNKYILRIDDINHENIDELTEIVNLYIDYKLELPSVGYNKETNIIDYTSLEKIGYNKTQSKTIRIKFSYWKDKYINSNIKVVLVYEEMLSKHEKLFIDNLIKLNIKVIIIAKDNLDIKYDTSINLRITDKKQVYTIAAKANERLNRELFDGNTLGLYRQDQFSIYNTVRLNVILDEIPNWLHSEVYLRPGYKSENNKVELPVIYTSIKGKNNDTWKLLVDSIYNKELTPYSFRNINEFRMFYPSQFNVRNNLPKMVIRHLTDVNRTAFEKQKPFVLNNKLHRERIKSGINYRYGILNEEKQDLILDTIEKLLDKFDNNILLNIGLNLPIDIINSIHTFNFYSKPNIIMLIHNGIEMFNDEDTIMFEMLSNMGFDIIILIPDGYNVDSKLNTNQIIAGTFDKLENSKENNKSFFSKLFKRR